MVPTFRALLACVFCGATIAGCGAETFVSAPTVGDAGPVGSAGPDGAAGPPGAPDATSSADVTPGSSACTPGMVPVTFGSTPSCIDRTEVTQSAYKKFLDTQTATGPTITLPAHCATKVDFAPGLDEDCFTNPFVPALSPEKPVSCVDWCDAWAYCNWDGKALCAPDRWRSACSQDGKRAYPYGSTYDQEKCGTDGSVVRAVASQPGCEGAAPGLFDMSGNVAEWVDACTGTSSGGGSSNTECRARGGHYGGGATTVGCGDEVVLDVATRTHQIGFRCCTKN